MGLLGKKKSAGIKNFKVVRKELAGKPQKKNNKNFMVSPARGLEKTPDQKKRSLENVESPKVRKSTEGAKLHSDTIVSGPISNKKILNQAGKKKKQNKFLQGTSGDKVTQSVSDSGNAENPTSTVKQNKKKKRENQQSVEAGDSKLPAGGSANAPANLSLSKTVGDSGNTEGSTPNTLKQSRKRKRGKKQSLEACNSESPAGGSVNAAANPGLSKTEGKKSKLASKEVAAEPTLPAHADEASPIFKKKGKNKQKPYEKTDGSGMQVMKGPKSAPQKKKLVPNQPKVCQTLENTKNTSGIGAASQKNIKKVQKKQATPATPVAPQDAKGKNQKQIGKNLPKENAKASESEPLKGKALKRKMAATIKTLSRLNEQRKVHANLLLKTKNTDKIKSIEERFRKINTKIGKFEEELQSLKNAKVSISPTKLNTSSKKLNTPPAKLKTSTNKLNSVTHKSDSAGPAKNFVGLPPEDVQLKKHKDKNLSLKDFLESQLKSSRFRWLNENLYNSSSGVAKEFFKEDPESFKAYHQGYGEQVAKWPVNPLDTIIKSLKSLPKGTVVADLGCGEAKLAASLPHLTVHSLDLVALKPEVIACDMAHCPLLRNSVDIVVFCLSLMGTNVSDFLLEANRILKVSGAMEIAEVESRFDDIDDFIKSVEKYEFEFKKKSSTNMFVFMTFSKKQDVKNTGKLPSFNLKPCLYKKR